MGGVAIPSVRQRWQGRGEGVCASCHAAGRRGGVVSGWLGGAAAILLTHLFKPQSTGFQLNDNQHQYLRPYHPTDTTNTSDTSPPFQIVHTNAACCFACQTVQPERKPGNCKNEKPQGPYRFPGHLSKYARHPQPQELGNLRSLSLAFGSCRGSCCIRNNMKPFTSQRPGEAWKIAELVRSGMPEVLVGV